MAVQQNKKSPSKRGMHRSHDGLDKPALAVEPGSGYYRGKKVIKAKGE